MTMIYILLNEQQSGPYSIEDVTVMLSKGLINDHSLAWSEGQKDWAPVGTLLPLLSAPLPNAPPSSNRHFCLQGGINRLTFLVCYCVLCFAMIAGQDFLLKKGYSLIPLILFGIIAVQNKWNLDKRC